MNSARCYKFGYVNNVYANVVALVNTSIFVCRCWNPIGTVYTTVYAARTAWTRYSDLSNRLLFVFNSNQSRVIRLSI
jgi:hypothetical protein